MLTVENLGKKFEGERVIEAATGVTFKLERGKFLAIVGRSGSGKSTLLGMLGGISKPSCGSVEIEGINQWELKGDKLSNFRNQKIGFVFQFASLLPALRAIDNVALPALICGALSHTEAYARAGMLMEKVGLRERTGSYPGQLSGGEQRRVAIARALINAPALLLADEPTADLDEETEEEILTLLVEMHRAFDCTLVVVTHNQSIADRADHVLEMQSGKARARTNIKAPNESLHTVQVGASSPVAEQLNRIFDKSSATEHTERVRLGEGIERLVGRLIIYVVPIILLGILIHAGVRNMEITALDAKAAERMALESLATGGLRADVKDVQTGPGQSYIVTLYLRNTTEPEQPIYMMPPAVRGFVQTGSSWQEVPMKPAKKTSSKVLKVDGLQTFQYVLQPDVKDFAQLIPYYMHVRISNDMLISPNPQPKSELVERNDNYYVYLKPHEADNKMILSKLKFPGDPPVWIPMPPH
ncbi:MAG: ABC transporter ATP-binding protein [Candidatus Obscuribacterales bacterium]|nr:ABC transporter ATP-binding protein [Candidatus Obscuribacterales bacterium]